MICDASTYQRRTVSLCRSRNRDLVVKESRGLLIGGLSRRVERVECGANLLKALVYVVITGNLDCSATYGCGV